ncbi:hypothetical protein OIV83_002547 [Microbotryomycetes sp. JL201]|nr:hypothetical protein OIV83_002547 [Microbotryomycetes sp. JL201]
MTGLPPSVVPASAPAGVALAAVDTTSAVGETLVTARRGSAKIRESFAALAAQERALQSDPKWRKYSQLVDKTLQSFEHILDWADFLTFLAKLLKCLQGFPQFQVVPHKLTVAKRLSQCLNPALPTGVHQRALDVYSHILTTIGPENLRRDLPAWSSGIFPFFQYAATSVKVGSHETELPSVADAELSQPIVLSIFERFYLPLQESLRPATKALILALLPGLEEEAGEFFEKVAALLDRLSGTVSPSFFFQNLWLVLITAPHSRIPALNYLSRRLPKMDSQDSPSPIVGQDIGLMIRGFAAALDDSQILVQRGILDLLIATLQLESVGFKSTRKQDQILLMRAVMGVVLRRDLSLSRRLYTWLLGPAENSESQVEYLKEHGLELLRAALQSEMASQTIDSVDRQRPFKIFISLLDKWEIGAALTEVLVLDAFSALRAALRPNDHHDELLMTGNMLFEILDPFLMWKQIHGMLQEAISGGSAGDPIGLTRFIIHTFRLHDEEVQKLHAPFVAFALIDLVELTVSSSETPLDATVLTDVLVLARELLLEIPHKFFESAQPVLDDSSRHLGRFLADSLYSAIDMKSASLPEVEGREILASGFVTVLRLVQNSTSVAGHSPSAGGSLVIASINLIFVLADATAQSGDPLQLPWSPEQWTTALVKYSDSWPASCAAFPLHSVIASSISTLSKVNAIRPTVKRNQRSLISALLSKLFDYLQPACAPCYVEAVRLVWAVDDLSDRKHMEVFISERLSSIDPDVRLPSFEAFGNLWRFTEDAQLPGVKLKAPMFRMLDSLKSDDLATKRAAEAWMRCSLKSYLRILDPLMFTLLDPNITFHSEMIKVDGVRLPILQYRRLFDQTRIHHVLDDMLSLARFGGQGFVRIAKGAFSKHTLDPALRERVLASELDTYTYLDGLVSVLVRFLRAEPSPELTPALAQHNQQVHSVVAELLQVIISRGEAEVSGLQAIEAALTSRLFLCVQRSELDLQNKLLHVLHSVIHAVSATRRHQRSASVTTETDRSREILADAQPPDLTREAMFVRTVSDAVSKQQNSATLHHWIDFLLMTVSQFRRSLHGVILPLIDCFVTRLQLTVTNLQATYDSQKKAANATMSETDAEFTVLVNALERLMLIAYAEAQALAPDEASKSADRTTSDSSSGAGGLLGYMSGVLGSTELEQSELPEEVKTKHAALQRLRDAVELLLFSLDTATSLEHEAGDDSSSSQGQFAAKIKVRARKALERLHKTSSADVLDDVIVHWHKLQIKGQRLESRRVLATVDTLSPSSQTVVSSIVEKLGTKGPAAVDKHRSPFAASENQLFAFLEHYLERLDGASAVQVWTTCLTFVRECLAASSAKVWHFFCLRCFTTLCEKVSQTSALEDRRMRRDLQETFIRLSDSSIQLAGRAVEHGGWLRRTVGESLNGDSDSVASRETKDTKEGRESEVVEGEKKLPVSTSPPSGQAQEIASFMASRVLPDLRRFLVDADKVVAVSSNIVYYLIAPAFKTRSRTFDMDPTVFELLHEMARNSQTLKAWRASVSDAFGDNRFFNAPPHMHQQWKPVVNALMASDKERLVELLAKISTVSSANIFTNRELESLSRALSLRRLTYVIFAGEKDRFLTQLPGIQEKLVDLLRSPVGDMVHAEVYLCLRALFCRIGNQQLAGLWPVILTELLRLFDSLVDHSVPDKSDLLHLVLSACKFLDLTLVLQTEEFQIHEWMFVTDTVDAIYPPDNWLPQAIMDRLGELVQNRAARTIESPVLAEKGEVEVADGIESAPSYSATGRRPFLVARKIDTIGELEPFFSRVSLASYESIYGNGGKVDVAAVETLLERDIFDG